MRRLLVATAVLALVAVPGASAATVTVKITAKGFSPATVTINVLDRVTWKNVDTVKHQVVADNGAFASPILAPGKSYTFRFRAAGRYRYHDALRPSLKGTVVVKGPPPSVSIALSAPIVVYGTSLTLTAQTSVHKSDETVVVQATPYGGSTTTAATLSTDSNGTATTTVTPDLFTTYVARWGSAVSTSVVAQVRPRIRFLPYSDGRMFTRVTASRSFAGRSVYVQKLSSFGEWVIVRKLTLGPLSGRVFAKPRASARYRIYMTTNQAGLGYLESWSGTQLIRHR